MKGVHVFFHEVSSPSPSTNVNVVRKCPKYLKLAAPQLLHAYEVKAVQTSIYGKASGKWGWIDGALGSSLKCGGLGWSLVKL